MMNTLRDFNNPFYCRRQFRGRNIGSPGRGRLGGFWRRGWVEDPTGRGGSFGPWRGGWFTNWFTGQQEKDVSNQENPTTSSPSENVEASKTETPSEWRYIGPCACGRGPHAFYQNSKGEIVHASKLNR